MADRRRLRGSLRALLVCAMLLAALGSPVASSAQAGAAEAGAAEAGAAEAGAAEAGAAQAGAAQDDAAQDDAAQEGPGGLFMEQVDVDIVNIDVFVTDRKGEPITGLEADDFEVKVDGKPVPLSNFYAVADGRPRLPTPSTEASDATAPPAVSLQLQRLEAIEVPEEQKLSMVVYVDNFNIEPLERNRVLPALRTFLGRTLGSADRAMLVTYDRTLKVRHPFTSSVEELWAALDELEDDSGHAILRARERYDTLRRIDRTNDARAALTYARTYAEQIMNEVTFTTRALAEIIDSLEGLPGRKAVLYVSSGVPMVSGEEVFHAIGERFETSEAYAEISRYDTSRDFEQITRQASTSRVVFYTLDAAGLRTSTLGAAEYDELLTPKMRQTVDSVIVENGQAPLRLLAEETGGRAILNRNDTLMALNDAARDFGNFYSLGIVASSADSGRWHELKVTVDRPGARVRHREGYRTRSLDGRVAGAIRSALRYELDHNPLGIEMAPARPSPHDDSGEWLVPLQIKIPLRDVVFLPRPDGPWESALQLYVGVVDDAGRFSAIDRSPLGLRLAEEHVEAAKGESMLYTHRLVTRSGPQKVAIAIVDTYGRQYSVASAGLIVGQSAPSL